jgi:hypothetical protein
MNRESRHNLVFLLVGDVVASWQNVFFNTSRYKSNIEKIPSFTSPRDDKQFIYGKWGFKMFFLNPNDEQ